MVSPFPGMDPWLEHPALWPGIHNALVASLQRLLGPRLRPRYVVRMEERTYFAEPEGLLLVGRPDLSVQARPAPEPAAAEPTSGRPDGGAVAVEVPAPDRVRESWLEIRGVEGGEVVTAVEFLSPSNKARGAGRDLYLQKRARLLGSLTSLVEIDLIRAGDPAPLRGNVPASEYRVLLSRGNQRPRAELYPFFVRSSIPVFPVPLRDPREDEPAVSLRPLLDEVFEVGGFDLSLDYRADPVPPLAEEDRAWADALLRQAGLR